MECKGIKRESSIIILKVKEFYELEAHLKDLKRQNMAGQSVAAGCKVVRPLMSVDYCDAHKRVITLYKAYYRFIPTLLKQFDIPKNELDCKWKIREYFYKNACVTDIRVIDMLVIKGYIELKEMTNNWQQKSHVLAHWHPTYECKRSDFIGKFLSGED